ncbi:MAG: TSUP family transporter, partial [Candidatus Zixiibacteriota bacterium]
MNQVLLCLILGLAAGTFSGLVGLGGGLILIPALMFFFGLTQHQAQGTTLAILVPPIGLLAAWTYHKAGYVDVKIAALVCLGFFFGGLLGAKLATALSNAALQKIFAVVLIVIAVKMLLGK